MAEKRGRQSSLTDYFRRAKKRQEEGDEEVFVEDVQEGEPDEIEAASEAVESLAEEVGPSFCFHRDPGEDEEEQQQPPRKTPEEIAADKKDRENAYKLPKQLPPEYRNTSLSPLDIGLAINCKLNDIEKFNLIKNCWKPNSKYAFIPVEEKRLTGTVNR